VPVHDWTRVYSGTIHAFHVSWIARLQDALNSGLLPDGYYALAEQHAGQMVPDVLTLAAGLKERLPAEPRGATALAEAPPRVSIHMSIDEETTYRTMRRTLTIRHRTGRRLVAMLEIVSPGNKDSQQHLEQFVDQSVAALASGVHLLVVDLHPAGPWDPQGIHAAIWEIVGGGSFELPKHKPFTLASYMADRMHRPFFITKARRPRWVVARKQTA
jgi:hypothetical protein